MKNHRSHDADDDDLRARRQPEQTEEKVAAFEGTAMTSLEVLQASLGNAGIGRLFAAREQAAREGVTRVPHQTQHRIETERGAGTPIGDEAQREMEPLLGADLSDVRLHTGPGAQDLAASLRAAAFTQGRDVFLGAGAGRETLAHELTHVAQGRTGPGTVQRQLWGDDEEEKKQVESAIAAPAQAGPVATEPEEIEMPADYVGNDPVEAAKYASQAAGSAGAGAPAANSGATAPPAPAPTPAAPAATGTTDVTSGAAGPYDIIGGESSTGGSFFNEDTSPQVLAPLASTTAPPSTGGGPSTSPPTVPKPGDPVPADLANAEPGSPQAEFVDKQVKSGAMVAEREPTVRPPGTPKPEGKRLTYQVPRLESETFSIDLTINGQRFHGYFTGEKATLQALREAKEAVSNFMTHWQRELEEVTEHRRETAKYVRFWSDKLGGVSLPDDDWQNVGPYLAQAQRLLDMTDSQLEEGVEEEAKKLEEFRETPQYLQMTQMSPDVARFVKAVGPGPEVEVRDGRHKNRISSIEKNLQTAANMVDERRRRIEEYVEGRNKGAGRAIGGMRVTIKLFEVATAAKVFGGARAAWIEGGGSTGGGLLVGSAAAGGTSAAFGSGTEILTEFGEMCRGSRDWGDFDWKNIGKIGLKNGVSGFVGAFVGGGLTLKLMSALGISSTGGQMFTGWLANVGSSPLNTAVGTVLEGVIDGKWPKNIDEFVERVKDEFVQNAAFATFISGGDMAVHLSGGGTGGGSGSRGGGGEGGGGGTGGGGTGGGSGRTLAGEGTPSTGVPVATPGTETTSTATPVAPARPQAGEGPISPGIPEPVTGTEPTAPTPVPEAVPEYIPHENRSGAATAPVQPVPEPVTGTEPTAPTPVPEAVPEYIPHENRSGAATAPVQPVPEPVTGTEPTAPARRQAGEGPLSEGVPEATPGTETTPAATRNAPARASSGRQAAGRTVGTEPPPQRTVGTEPPRRRSIGPEEEGAPGGDDSARWNPSRLEPPRIVERVDDPARAADEYWRASNENPDHPPNFTPDGEMYQANWELARGTGKSPPAWRDQYGQWHVDATRVDVHNPPARANEPGGGAGPSGPRTTRSMPAETPAGGPPPMPGEPAIQSKPNPYAAPQAEAAPAGAGRQRMAAQTDIGSAPTLPGETAAPAHARTQRMPAESDIGRAPTLPGETAIQSKPNPYGAPQAEAAPGHESPYRDPVEASQVLADHVLLRKPVRLLDHESAEALWPREYGGGQTEVPAAWYEPGGEKMVVDASRVRMPLFESEIHQGPIQRGSAVAAGGQPPRNQTLPGIGGESRLPAAPRGNDTQPSLPGGGSGGGRGPGGGGPGGGAAGPRREAGPFYGIDAIDSTNSPVEAARALRQALDEGSQFRLLGSPDTPLTAQEAWNGSFGRPGEAPLAWRDLYGNVYIDNQRVRISDLLGPRVQEGSPNFEPLPDLEPAPAASGESRPAVFDPEAAILPGEVRGVRETIDDPAQASRLFYEHRAAGRFVRFINNRSMLEHAWTQEYGGSGPPPPAWIDSKGYLVVDAQRVDLPFRPEDIPQGPER